jgi:hypothetical protein
MWTKLHALIESPDDARTEIVARENPGRATISRIRKPFLYHIYDGNSAATAQYRQTAPLYTVQEQTPIGGGEIWHNE